MVEKHQHRIKKIEGKNLISSNYCPSSKIETTAANTFSNFPHLLSKDCLSEVGISGWRVSALIWYQVHCMTPVGEYQLP